MLLYGISWYHAPVSYWYYRSDSEGLTWQKMETRRRKKRYFCWTSSLSPTGPFAHRISWVGENKMVQCKSFYYPRLPCWRSPFYHHKRFYLTTWCGVSDEARVHCCSGFILKVLFLVIIIFSFHFKSAQQLDVGDHDPGYMGKFQITSLDISFIQCTGHRVKKTTFWKQLNTRYLLFCSVQQQVEELRLAYRRKNISNIFNTLEREKCVEV